MEKKPDEAVAVPAVTGGAGGKRRRRYSAPEKLGLLAEAESPGGSISLVSRKYGVSSSQLFRWRHLRDAGSLTGLQGTRAAAAAGAEDGGGRGAPRGHPHCPRKKLLSPAVLAKMEALL